MPSQLNIENLSSLIKEKIRKKERNSYTDFLVKNGLELMCRKVGEEAIEVMIASFAYEKKPSKKTKNELVGEICDLFYHSLVLMAAQDINIEEIFTEFHKRNSNKSKKK